MQRIALTTSKQVSSIQTPGCLVYKGDCTTQFCREYTIIPSHAQDPHKPISIGCLLEDLSLPKAAPWGADGPELQRRMQEHFDSGKGGGGASDTWVRCPNTT